MPENGAFIRPYINFTGADSNVGGTPQQKNSREEYMRPEEKEPEEENDKLKQSEFVDRSAQLRASLNSLAMLNVVSVKKKKAPKEQANKKVNAIKNIFKEID